MLGKAGELLSPRMQGLLARLRSRWLALATDVAELTAVLTRHAAQSELCSNAITVPGIGPMIATATVAASGKGRMFKSGRGMAAWLGLVRGGFGS